MKKEISVSVCGVAGSGKSTVAKLIHKCLAEHGIDVVLVDDNGSGIDDSSPNRDHTLQRRVKTLGTVSVKTISTPKR
jgi:adenylylsulfate kinase-like enzyme